jgi:hypothetical protein
LYAQARGIRDLSVVLLRRRTICAPERLGHSGDIVPLGPRDQPGQRQELAPSFLREGSEERAVGLDGAQHAHAGVYIVFRQRGARKIRVFMAAL